MLSPPPGLVELSSIAQRRSEITTAIWSKRCSDAAIFPQGGLAGIRRKISSPLRRARNLHPTSILCACASSALGMVRVSKPSRISARIFEELTMVDKAKLRLKWPMLYSV